MGRGAAAGRRPARHGEARPTAHRVRERRRSASRSPACRAVDARGQGGLLDVALSPAFESDRTIYLSYSEPRQGGNGTTVARGVLSADRRSLEQVRVIFRAMPTYDGTMHYGSRLAFGPDGMLYVTLGERSDTPMRKYAQQLDSHLGKILRIKPDGSAPTDNPFVGKAGRAARDLDARPPQRAGGRVRSARGGCGPSSTARAAATSST